MWRVVMYQKMVSYIYEYIQEEKGANIGFVKLALQNHQYKMKIHLKNMCLEGQELTVYGFVREETDLHTIPFGTVKVIGGIGEGLFLGSTEELSSKYRFLDMSGLLFVPKQSLEQNQGKINRFCATQWDNIPLTLDGLDILKKETELVYAAEFVPEEAGVEEETAYSENDTAQEPVTEGEEQHPINDCEDSQITLEESQDANGNINQETNQEEESIWELFEQRRVEMQERFEKIKDRQMDEEPRKWKEGERILAEYTPMCPFFDEQVQASVRIEPKDIGVFPMEYWYLANNSFLLHGYYCYRHLLFMKLEGEKENIYAIGVPGNSHYRERFMANMFGFEEFKPVRKKENAGFGYWWKKIY